MRLRAAPSRMLRTHVVGPAVLTVAGSVLVAGCQSPTTQTNGVDDGREATFVPHPSVEPHPSTKGQLAFRVDESALTEDIVEYVARVGAETTIEVSAGDTLEDAIRAHCGRVDPWYVEFLRHSGSLPDIEPLDVTYEFHSSRAIQLPACLWIPEYDSKEVIAERNDSPWTYFSEESTGFEYFAANYAVETAAMRDRTPTYLDAFRTLNDGYAASGVVHEGQTVWVPRRPATSWVSVNVAKSSPVSLAVVRRTLGDQLSKGGQDPASLVMEEDRHELRLYADLTPAELAATNSCQAAATSGPWGPLDALRLAQIVSFNTSELSRRNTAVGSATVVIADTGLLSTGDGPPFPDRSISLGNNRAWRKRYAAPPRLAHAHHGHGTYVATTALGGPEFMKASFALLGSKLKITPVNFIFEVACESPDGTCLQVDAEAFYAAAEFAEKTRGILNLSVGKSTPMEGLTKYVGTGSDVLLVVAAGNDGRSLVDKAVFPARLGGRDASNVITVAATDVNGRVAKFSNFGSEYVEIAAPGCLQPVLARNTSTSSFHIARASGTSLATPLVSFTAALLKLFWPDATPAEIKRRILSGADISPWIQPTEVSHSRVLNVEKALSLFQDVVTFEIDGVEHTTWGRILSSYEIFDLCQGRRSLFRFSGTEGNRNIVKKIARITDDGDEVLLIDWTTPEGRFMSDTCVPSEVPLEIRDGFDGSIVSLTSGQIHDVTFAEFP